jgi:hypothetical protein
MRRFAAACFISLLLSYSSTAQEKNTDAFVRTLCQAIRNNDTASFVKQFITYPQFQNMMLESLRKNHDSVQVSGIVASYSESQYRQDITRALREQFATFRNKLRSRGANPSEVVFVKGVYEETVPKDFPTQTYLVGTIFLKDNKEEYKTRFSTTWLQNQKGWFTISLGDVFKKDEAISERDSIITVTDSVTKVEEVEEPPPPPPPASPISKKQAKTKSSARKTKVKA